MFIVAVHGFFALKTRYWNAGSKTTNAESHRETGCIEPCHLLLAIWVFGIEIDGCTWHGTFSAWVRTWQHTGVSENRATPKSFILIGFSIINHPFWGTPIFGNIHIRTWQHTCQTCMKFYEAAVNSEKRQLCRCLYDRDSLWFPEAYHPKISPTIK